MLGGRGLVVAAHRVVMVTLRARLLCSRLHYLSRHLPQAHLLLASLTVVITQTTACAWPGYTFTYQSPSQFNLEFSQISRNLYIKIMFVVADGNLSLEVSDQIGKTLEVNANFSNLFSHEALSMLCT